MTEVDEPTMPANCRFVVTLPVGGLPAGVPFELFVCEVLGATRDNPDPSSSIGLARVRFSALGGLISIGGNWPRFSCRASGGEKPRPGMGARKLGGSRRGGRRGGAVIVGEKV